MSLQFLISQFGYLQFLILQHGYLQVSIFRSFNIGTRIFQDLDFKLLTMKTVDARTNKLHTTTYKDTFI